MSTSSSRNYVLGLSIAGSGAVLFASKGLFSKALAAGGVDFVTLTALRALLALPMFAVLGLWRGLSWRRAPPRTLAYAALAGVLCYAVGALLDFHALEIIDVSLERALMFSYPALIVAWQSLRYRKIPQRSVVIALCLTYAGIVLVVGAFDAHLWRQNLGGSLLVLLCAATTAAYFLLGERCIPELGSSGFTIIAMGAAAVMVCLTFALTHPLSTLVHISAHQWLLLLALAVLCMFLPTLCQAEGIRRIGAERGSLASTIGPPTALLIGMSLLGERPGPWQLVGTGLIVTGIVVIARMGPPRGQA